MNDYGLEIISREQHPRKLKKFQVDNEDIIGVYENEPFAVRFKNNTSNKVQVRISIDGTDVLTGRLASTEPEGQMWVLSPYSDLELKAWPETNTGGAEFLFSHAKDSVAAHTHGNMTGRGLIAAAIYVDTYRVKSPQTWISPIIWWDGTPAGRYTTAHNIRTQSNSGYYESINSTVDHQPAVGAGTYVGQAITKTAGLSNPTFHSIIQVKYEWWTNLKSRLRNYNKAFPADQQRIMDLGDTPRRSRRRRRGKPRIAPEKKYIEYNRFL